MREMWRFYASLQANLWVKRQYHIPSDLVVGRFRGTLIATRGEDLQVEHPVWRRQDPAFHFDPTLTRMQGSALIDLLYLSA